MTDKKIAEATIERLQAELQRRRDERIARGEVAFVPAIVVGHPGAIDRAKAAVVTGLRAQGESREIVFGFRDAEGQLIEAIATGVPRPGRDDGIPWPVAAIEHEKEAAARLDAFHEGAKDHKPQPSAPLPKPIDVTPPGDLELYGITVQIVAPTPGDLGMVREGRYGVRDRVVYVMDDQGSHVSTRLLHEGEGDAKTIARSLLRDYYVRRHNPFYDPIVYPPKAIH
jgi:hypothetical protein